MLVKAYRAWGLWSIRPALKRRPPAQAIACVSGRLVMKGQTFGDDLLSRAVSRQVPSALSGLTTGFEMGPGVPLTHRPPKDCDFLGWCA